MVQITCKQMGGPCEEILEGENPKDIFVRIFMHIKESPDPKHQEMFKEMENMTDEDCKKWDEMIGKVCAELKK